VGGEGEGLLSTGRARSNAVAAAGVWQGGIGGKLLKAAAQVVTAETDPQTLRKQRRASQQISRAADSGSNAGATAAVLAAGTEAFCRRL